jgi:hypothetical protein
MVIFISPHEPARFPFRLAAPVVMNKTSFYSTAKMTIVSVAAMAVAPALLRTKTRESVPFNVASPVHALEAPAESRTVIDQAAGVNPKQTGIRAVVTSSALAEK